MIAGPVFVGATQATFRLVVDPAVGDTVGAAGMPGGSSTSVTVIVTVMVSVPPLPSSALTVTVWVDLASWL